MSLKIEQLPFGNMPDGRPVFLFRLINECGAIAEISNYGATLISVQVPDKNGCLKRVVKGFPSVEAYLADREIGTYLGASVGRYANRIAKGKFTLNDEEYVLPVNNGENSLHGGVESFHTKCWEYALDEEYVHFTYHSKDGEEGYPGNLDVKISYGWSATNELSILYRALGDKDCPVNLTSHAYFNLAGQGDILNHRLKIHADKYIPIYPDAIPTGEIRMVKGTPFDFSDYKAVGAEINSDNEQLQAGKGYDHCFVINKKEFGDLALAVEVYAPETSLGLKVWTSLPGIQFYSGNYLRSDLPSLDGTPLAYRQAFCLEPEYFPDSPNQSGFPDCILKAGQEYSQDLIYQFTLEEQE